MVDLRPAILPCRSPNVFQQLVRHIPPGNTRGKHQAIRALHHDASTGNCHRHARWRPTGGQDLSTHPKSPRITPRGGLCITGHVCALHLGSVFCQRRACRGRPCYCRKFLCRHRRPLRLHHSHRHGRAPWRPSFFHNEYGRKLWRSCLHSRHTLC